MELSITEQGLLILYAFVFGAAVGLLYDFFRIFRLAFGGKSAAIFIEDMIFWLICAIIAFLFFMRFNGGQVRLYCFPGFAAGACAYFLTISRFFMRFSRFFINKLKKMIKFILHLIGKPIIILGGKLRWLFRKIGSAARKVKVPKPRRPERQRKRKGRGKRET